MGTRYASSSVLDYCFNPKHIYKDGKHLLVPCQKCDGCLLHKANEWSRRISLECEHSIPLFFTLTYDNRFLPRLYPLLQYCDLPYTECQFCTCKCYDRKKVVSWFSDHVFNVRFDGSRVVEREDHILINDSVYYDLSDITNWNDFPSIQYCSKRDIQLWLKLIQKAVYERFNLYGTFRYFVIGELGPLHQRCHVHGLLFFQKLEVATFVKESCIYPFWQMCDPNRCIPYIRLSDGRIGNYVSNYVTCINRLPQVYRDHKSVRPFRLASKAPAIGYSAFNVTEIFEAIYRRTIEYTKPVTMLGRTYVLRYPSDYCRTIFPKTFRYAELDFNRLLLVYGCLFTAYRIGFTRSYLLSSGFFDCTNQMDYQAMFKCYRIVRRYGKELALTPWLYVFWLDQYYYLSDMYALRMMYSYEASFDFSLKENRIRLFFIYSDISVVLNDKESFTLADLVPYARLLKSVGLDYSDFYCNPDFLVKLHSISSAYRCEIEDILNNCEKQSKYNELTNNSPSF